MNHISFEDLSCYIDRELPDWRMREIKEHIEDCPICKERLEAILAIDNGIRSSYKEFDVETFSLEVLERIKPKATRYSFRLKLATIGIALSLLFGIGFGYLRNTYRGNLEREKYQLISQHYIISSGDMGIIFVSKK